MVRRRSYIDHVERGFLAEKNGDLERAEREYRAAISDGDAYGYNNLAQVMSEMGRVGEAEFLYRKGVEHGDALAAHNLVLFLLEEGKDVLAAKAMRTAHRLGKVPTEEDMAGSRAYFADNHAN